MLDARNIYRKVTRKIYDFSPEQMQNLAAIVWLYRGQQKRFLGLVRDYLDRVCAESAAVPEGSRPSRPRSPTCADAFDALAKAVAKHADLDAGKKQALADAVSRTARGRALYEGDGKKLLASLADIRTRNTRRRCPRRTMRSTRRARRSTPFAEAIRGLVKQVDLLYKLAGAGGRFWRRAGSRRRDFRRPTTAAPRAG